MKPNITRMKATIDYDQILQKYWELANLPTNDTKGSITGQLKALESLSEELRRAPQEPAKPRFYRAGWMPKVEP